METLSQFIHIILHLNLYVTPLFQTYGREAYFFIALIIFCETGLVVAIFLPGDSLLFASGIVIAAAGLNVHIFVLLMIAAAFLGDNSNYWLGRQLGRKVFHENSKILKLKYLDATERFYQKHGPKAIVLARFVPLFRTLVPFFAGLSKMRYPQYLVYCFLSAAVWISLIVYVSYWFGNIPFVKAHFSLMILLIVFVSVIPAVLQVVRARLRK